ncbi:MAG: hypothetical protein ACRENP_07605 [Longimicrobiales bacterium]
MEKQLSSAKNVTLPRRSLPVALCMGALVGALVLGMGGRVAMRVFALLDGLNPGLSLGGTVTVVFLGACAGAFGGGLLWLGRRAFPGSAVLRGLLFWGAMLLLTARVLNPLSVQRVILFAPLTLLYGGLIYRLWCQRFIARWRLSPAQSLAVK